MFEYSHCLIFSFLLSSLVWKSLVLLECRKIALEERWQRLTLVILSYSGMNSRSVTCVLIWQQRSIGKGYSTQLPPAAPPPTSLEMRTRVGVPPRDKSRVYFTVGPQKCFQEATFGPCTLKSKAVIVGALCNDSIKSHCGNFRFSVQSSSYR